MRRAKSGSSPRGRGKLADQGLTLDGLGLIPAWAGKTSFLIVGELELGAHPRVGGENMSRLNLGNASMGSSPRGRGKLGLHLAVSVSGGLIPAWAGKTIATPCLRGYHAAHPRVGGENSAKKWGARPTEGSSPRGRGKPSP